MMMMNSWVVFVNGDIDFLIQNLLYGVFDDG